MDVLGQLDKGYTLKCGSWLVAAIVVYSLVAASGSKSKQSQEPPEVSPLIPYIGHVLGLLWYKNHYYTRLRLADVTRHKTKNADHG